MKLDWEKIENEAVGILQDLLRMDTTNPPGNEYLAANYIKELLEKEGLKPVIVEKEPGRSNLVVRLPGRGTGSSLMLDSHLDVVRAEAKEWRVPPFSGEIRDGFIWGRGALDMKAMTAMSLAVLLIATRNKIPLKGDLVFTATADEEDGANLGAFYLIDEQPDLIRADYALGEVGGMSLTHNGRRIYPVQVAEKGICWLKLTVTGQGGHGSLPRRDAVPERVQKVLKILTDLRFPIDPHPAVREFLEAMAKASPAANAAVLRLIKQGKGASFLLDTVVPKDISQSLRALLSHTCQPTVVECGRKINVVPSEATLFADCRMLPGTSAEQMLKMVADKVGGLAEVELQKGQRGHAISPDNPLFKQIVKTMSIMDPGGVVSPYLMSGFTNGGAYSRMGIKYMGFTPLLLPPAPKFFSMFHAADERVPVDGFKWGVRTLYEVVKGFLFER